MDIRLTGPLAVVCLVVGGLAQQKTNSPVASRPAASAETTYRDSTLGFLYRIPYGWVDRTKEMQETDPVGKGQVRLAVFERPPQAAGESVNSAVVIAAEPADAYPGLKTAEDYLEPLTALTTAKGFKAEGDPTEVMIDSQRLVRADFSKSITDKISMHQSTLVMLKKGKVITFTFLGDSSETIDSLIERIDFAGEKSRSK